MRKMSMKKEILVIMMVVLMLLTVSTKVLATGTGGPISINIVAPTTNTTTETNTTTTNTTTTNTTTNIVTPATTNTTTSNYQNTTLPQTGDASDYAIFLLIAVAIIVAVYAYKKVRDYNIK